MLWDSVKCFFKGPDWDWESKRFFNFAYYDTKRREKCSCCGETKQWEFGPR